MSLLNSVKNCYSVNGNDDILNKFWEYEGIYEKRLRRVNMEEKWVKEMIEKDKWNYIM